MTRRSAERSKILFNDVWSPGKSFIWRFRFFPLREITDPQRNVAFDVFVRRHPCRSLGPSKIARQFLLVRGESDRKHAVGGTRVHRPRVMWIDYERINEKRG